MKRVRLVWMSGQNAVVKHCGFVDPSLAMKR
jgi:hypothetical protein